MHIALDETMDTHCDMTRLTDTLFPLAFVQIAEGGDVDKMFEELAQRLHQMRWRVGGFLQRTIAEPQSRHATMYLENIATHQITMLSQPLGAGSSGCRLNFDVLGQATYELATKINTDYDVLILNRFGKAESEGQGFRSVIAAALEYELPVITAVKPIYREAWDLFAAEFAQELPFELERLLDWSCSNLKPIDCS